MAKEKQDIGSNANTLVEILNFMRHATNSFQRVCTYSLGGELADKLMKEHGKYIDLGPFTVRIELFPRMKDIDNVWWILGMALYAGEGLIGEIDDLYIDCDNIVIDLNDICITVRLK